MARERTYRTEAIVLRRRDFSEADRLLTLYSREYGKITAIAKGARKPQSRKTGHVELFMRTKFLVAKARDIDIATQAEMIEAYPGLRGDLVRTTYASYAIELLDRFTPEEEPHRDVYDLIANGLHWFAMSDNLLLVARFYELRLLSYLGYQPQLFNCVISDDEIQDEDQYFSAELGGIIAPGYEMHDFKARPISASAVKLLRFLQTRSWSEVQAVHLKRKLHAELETIMSHYISHTLERNLESLELLMRLRDEARTLSLKGE